MAPTAKFSWIKYSYCKRNSFETGLLRNLNPHPLIRLSKLGFFAVKYKWILLEILRSVSERFSFWSPIPTRVSLLLFSNHPSGPCHSIYCLVWLVLPNFATSWNVSAHNSRTMRDKPACTNMLDCSYAEESRDGLFHRIRLSGWNLNCIQRSDRARNML